MDKNKEEEAAIQRAEQAFSERRGYYSLEMTASIVAESKNVPLRSGQPSYLIWAKAVSARERGWRVSGGLTRPKDDFAIPVRELQREENSFVYLSDFIEWAIEAGCTIAPSAVKEARQECEVSDAFEHRVRLWEIERTRAELRNSKTQNTEVILARDARITEFDRERSEIIAFLWGHQPASELTDAPTPTKGPNAGWPQLSASHEKRWREWIQLTLRILDEPSPPTAMTDLARRVKKRGNVTEGIECIRKRIAVESVRVRIDALKLGKR